MPLPSSPSLTVLDPGNIKPYALSRQFYSENAPAPPDTIPSPSSLKVAAFTWEIVSLVQKAQATEPNPGNRPTNRLFVPSCHVAGCVSILILLELSATFHTVSNPILLNRLSTNVNLSDTALSWSPISQTGSSSLISMTPAPPLALSTNACLKAPC